MLLVGRQEGHLACKKTDWWGAGMVICLERGANLHMAQLMPLPLTVSCFSKIQIGFTFLVLAHRGNPGKRAVKRVCVCVYIHCLTTITLNQRKSVRQVDNKTAKCMYLSSCKANFHCIQLCINAVTQNKKN